MLVGHVAAAFVGKTIVPKPSLGTLVLATMLPDILWPIFSIAGLEYTAGNQRLVENNRFVAPISHSLLMVTIWGALFATAYFLRRRYLRGAVVLFIMVISHWLFDAIAHKHLAAIQIRVTLVEIVIEGIRGAAGERCNGHIGDRMTPRVGSPKGQSINEAASHLELESIVMRVASGLAHRDWTNA